MLDLGQKLTKASYHLLRVETFMVDHPNLIQNSATFKNLNYF